MAIRLIDRYPNRANPANSDYPHGSGRNKSSPTAIDGTPFDETRYNDHEGFFQSLLEAAEITPNNTPDTVPASQYADALSIVANGLIVIDVAGNANATLDFNQKRVHGFRLTGILTGNIEVIVPDTERMYTVVNDTTGDFTVTVKTALGAGVVATQGQTFVVRCDGADVVRGLDSQRTIYVGSVAELEALSLPAGTNVYLTDSSRYGEGVIKSGVAPSDPQKGVYIPIANGNYWERLDKDFVTPNMFGGRNSTAIQAAFNSGFPVDLGAHKDYSLTTGVTLNNGQIIKADGALFTRATGSGAFDVVSGTDIEVDIRGWWSIDGNKADDALVRATASHRFCGFRFIRCTGYVEKLRADNTVNGEIQAEGIRAGIMFEDCDGLKAYHLRGKGNDGSAVFPYESAMTCQHVYTSNNTGSGFTSYNCPDAEFHDIESVTSGYSGISVNGVRMKCSNLRAFAAASGYSGVNIGHDNPLNRANDSVISGIQSHNCSGWGVTVFGSDGITILGANIENSTSHGLRIFSNSANVTMVGLSVKNSASRGLSVESGIGHKLIGASISLCNLYGAYVDGGASLHVDPTSKIYNNCSDALGFLSNVACDGAGSFIRFEGSSTDSVEFGLSASNSGRILSLDANVRNNTLGNFREAGGTVDNDRTRTSDESFSGQFTATGSSTVTTVSNQNVTTDIEKIFLTPLNSSAAALNYFISSVSPGVSFNVTFTAAAAGTENFGYRLL